MFFHADVNGRPRVRLRFSWLFGLVRQEIAGKKGKPSEKKRATRAGRKRRRADIMLIFRVLKTKGLLKRLQELLKDMFSRFNFRDLVADFKVGLGDPADTGLLFAIIGPATALFGSSRLYQIKLEPDFGDDAVLQGYSYGVIRLRPIQLVTPALKFTFSLTTVRLARTLILSKWKRKKK